MGGTFLAIIIAYFKAKKIDSVHSSTFFTTVLDYTHPGELGIFFNEATINYIKEDIKLKGYFDGKYLSNSKLLPCYWKTKIILCFNSNDKREIRKT
jgi:polyhydroxyalkanoate synthase